MLDFPEALEFENARLILISFDLFHAAMIVENPKIWQPVRIRGLWSTTGVDVCSSALVDRAHAYQFQPAKWGKAA